MNQRNECTCCEPASSDAMKQLLTRHSVGPKHLLPPAPTEEQVCLAVAAALRAPDHQKLVPFRFVFASGGMRPGVIKMGFATGGRFSPGLGPAYASRDYTPLHNQLVDPSALSPIMGFPAFADMIVKVRKV